MAHPTGGRTQPQAPCPRAHRVIVELDARGEIDRHAAMCLRQAIGEARPSAIEMVLVDLRDLTAIDPAGLALLNGQRTQCHARGTALGLLVSDRERHERLTEALVGAGLGDTLHPSHEPDMPALPDRARLRLPASWRTA